VIILEDPQLAPQKTGLMKLNIPAIESIGGSLINLVDR